MAWSFYLLSWKSGHSLNIVTCIARQHNKETVFRGVRAKGLSWRQMERPKQLAVNSRTVPEVNLRKSIRQCIWDCVKGNWIDCSWVCNKTNYQSERRLQWHNTPQYFKTNNIQRVLGPERQCTSSLSNLGCCFEHRGHIRVLSYEKGRWR
jgi:hypothetical protein